MKMNFIIYFLIKEANWIKYLHMMIANETCEKIREALQNSGHRLNELITNSHSG